MVHVHAHMIRVLDMAKARPIRSVPTSESVDCADALSESFSFFHPAKAQMQVAILYRLRKMRNDVVEMNGLTDKRENT